jgi:hypothetical protein
LGNASEGEGGMRTVQELPRQFIRLPYPWEDGYRLSLELGPQVFLMEHGRRLKSIILSPPFLLALPFILLVVLGRAAVTVAGRTSHGNNQRNGLSFLSLVKKDVSRIVRKIYSPPLGPEGSPESGTQREVEDFERGHKDAHVRSASSGSEEIIIQRPSISKSFWSVSLGIASIVIVVAGAVVVADWMGGLRIPAVPSTTTPPSATPTTATPEPTPTPLVRRSTGSRRLILTNGETADLDSMDPTWGVHRKPDPKNGYDIEFAYGDLYFGSRTFFAKVGGQPSYKTCLTAIAYYSPGVSPGSELCVRTNEKRLAFLTVKKIKENASQDFPVREQIQLDVTVWEST